MKRQLFMLACAAVAAIGTACSSDPALKTAVISPMEEPSEQIQRQFANEIRTLNDLEMKQEVLTNCNGVLRYCQAYTTRKSPANSPSWCSCTASANAARRTSRNSDWPCLRS